MTDTKALVTPARDGIAAFVQARMASRRLPGKVLCEVAGKPLLQYLLERLSQCRQLGRVVVVTSRHPSDDPIAAFCDAHGTECVRGDLDNVASRFRDALERHDFAAFVRISGDSPLLDPALVDQAVDVFRTGGYQIVTNVMPRTYPRGQSVEVLDTGTFRGGFADMQNHAHFEHVTPYFYKSQRCFTIYNIAAPHDCSDVRLSVDTKADLDGFSRIVAAFTRPQWEYGLAEILDIYRRVAAEPEQ